MFGKQSLSTAHVMKVSVDTGSNGRIRFFTNRGQGRRHLLVALSGINDDKPLRALHEGLIRQAVAY